MRKDIPSAFRYTPEAVARMEAEAVQALALEHKRKLTERVKTGAVSDEEYDKLTAEDRAIVDDAKQQQLNEFWSENPEAVIYNKKHQQMMGALGNIRDLQSNSILEAIRGVPSYDIVNYNDQIDKIRNSDLAPEKKMELIKAERTGYIQAMDALINKRMDRAKSVRATRHGFKAQLMSYFSGPIDILTALKGDDSRAQAEA